MFCGVETCVGLGWLFPVLFFVMMFVMMALCMRRGWGGCMGRWFDGYERRDPPRTARRGRSVPTIEKPPAKGAKQ